MRAGDTPGPHFGCQYNTEKEQTKLEGIFHFKKNNFWSFNRLTVFKLLDSVFKCLIFTLAAPLPIQTHYNFKLTFVFFQANYEKNI